MQVQASSSNDSPGHSKEVFIWCWLIYLNARVLPFPGKTEGRGGQTATKQRSPFPCSITVKRSRDHSIVGIIYRVVQFTVKAITARAITCAFWSPPAVVVVSRVSLFGSSCLSCTDARTPEPNSGNTCICMCAHVNSGVVHDKRHVKKETTVNGNCDNYPGICERRCLNAT